MITNRDVNQETFDLVLKIQTFLKKLPLRDPKEILKEMEVLDSQTNVILKSIKDFL